MDPAVALQPHSGQQDCSDGGLALWAITLLPPLQPERHCSVERPTSGSVGGMHSVRCIVQCMQHSRAPCSSAEADAGSGAQRRRRRVARPTPSPYSLTGTSLTQCRPRQLMTTAAGRGGQHGESVPACPI